MTKRLQILESSLIKKEELLRLALDNHFISVKQTNGQPLNDKRNGQAIINKWEKQDRNINNLMEGVELTKNAIEKEKRKIDNINDVKGDLPKCILDMLESGELIQWRKHPTTFFVKGVDKTRIVWDNKKRLVFFRYKEAITEQSVWSIFVKTFNSLVIDLKKELELNSSESKKQIL